MLGKAFPSAGKTGGGALEFSWLAFTFGAEILPTFMAARLAGGGGSSAALGASAGALGCSTAARIGVGRTGVSNAELLAGAAADGAGEFEVTDGFSIGACAGDGRAAGAVVMVAAP